MKPIGVMGNSPSMPAGFPMHTPENFGNMVHANAPFKLFPNCVYIRDDVSRYGQKDFLSFLNNKCSHLIITLANTLKPNDPDHKKYNDLTNFIDKVKVPIVIFGLGVKHSATASDKLNTSAIEFLNTLAKKTAVLGVRGDITKQIILRDTEVSNVVVIGCPSFYTNPKELLKINENSRNIDHGKFAFSGTNYKKSEELHLLMNALNNDNFILEPSNKFAHQYYIECLRARDDHFVDPPYYLKPNLLKSYNLGPTQLKEIFLKNYRVFRNYEEWCAFNKECVSFTYGTRFHVNMASILCGVPALWITHDDRTREMTSLFSLPSVSLERAVVMNRDDLVSEINYGNMMNKLPDLFGNFNDYLRDNGLPQVDFF